MNIEIPETIFKSTGLTKEQILKLLALTLYDNEKLSIGHASKLANISQAEFIDLMAQYEISLKYDIEDVKSDFDNLKDL